jgi:hypothetical protein
MCAAAPVTSCRSLSWFKHKKEPEQSNLYDAGDLGDDLSLNISSNSGDDSALSANGDLDVVKRRLDNGEAVIDILNGSCVPESSW